MAGLAFSWGPALVVVSDMRTGLAGGQDEANGGDGAAALLIGEDTDGPVIAELLGGASSTNEFLDRWRTVGANYSKLWEERFSETAFGPVIEEAVKEATSRPASTPRTSTRS